MPVCFIPCPISTLFCLLYRLYFPCLSFIVVLFFLQLFIFICQLSPLISDFYMIVNFLFIFLFTALSPPVFLYFRFYFYTCNVYVSYSSAHHSLLSILSDFPEPVFVNLLRRTAIPSLAESILGSLNDYKYGLSCYSVNCPVTKFLVPERMIKLTPASGIIGLSYPGVGPTIL